MYVFVLCIHIAEEKDKIILSICQKKKDNIVKYIIIENMDVFI